MTDSEFLFKAVKSATGVSKKKILSSSRIWPIQEARMLYIAAASSQGFKDEMIGWIIGRERTTVLKTRHKADDYSKFSRSFREKFSKVLKSYADSKQI